MSIKHLIKATLQTIFAKRPVLTTAQVTKLSRNDLLKGRWALITGGTSGIGYAIADAMLFAGASVVITGRNKQRLDDAKTTLLAGSDDRIGRVLSKQMDNSDTKRLEERFEEICRSLNGQPLSILVNNAGVLGGEFGHVTEEKYDQIMDTNLKGTFFLSQIVARYMVDNHIEGNILNIGSSSSHRPAASAYTLTKWGIRGLTLGMAKMLAPHGITVNAIAPGPTATPMLIKDPSQGIYFEKNPIGRFAMPEEIANMAVVLTSGLGKTVIGDMVFMTGGAGLITYDDVPYNF